MPLLNPNADLEKLKHAAVAARRPFEKDWWLNIAFFLGEQYTEWNAEALNIRRIAKVDDPKKRAPRPVINKINHFVLQQHVNALDARPTPDALPANDDPMSISDAVIAKAYLDWVGDPQVANIPRAFSQSALWALVCGSSFMQWCWNPKLKRPEVLPLSPFDLYPDPYATDFKRCRYVIQTRFMDPEQVYDTWGKDLKAQAVDTDQTKTALLREMGSAPVLNGVTVNELWHLPTRRYPEGRYVVWSDKERLDDRSSFPYEHKHIPFTMLGVVPRPGTIWYDSNVKYLRPAQMELNQYHAQRIMIRKNFANAKWWIDDQLEMQELPDDSPFQVLKGNSQGGQFEPKIIQGAAMADNNEGEWLSAEMMNVVGLHEVSQGQVPGRVEAAKAIAELKDSDSSRLAELTDMIKDSSAEGGWQILQLGKQFQDDDTLLTIYSNEGIPEVRRFKKDAIHEGMRVSVTMGTALGRTRVEREDRVFKLIEAGVLTDPERIATLLDVPLTQFISSAAFDVRLARNENYAIADGTGVDGKPGQAIQPNSWDNHAIHIREHNNFRKTHEYTLLDPDVKQKFEFHVQAHEMLQKTVLTQQAQLAALVAGAAGQAPQPQPLPPNQPIGGFTGPGALKQEDQANAGQ